MRRLASAVVLLSLAACDRSPLLLHVPEDSSAPTLSRSDAARPIPGRFIVTLREGANPGAVAREHGVQPEFVYQHALLGFAGTISEAARAGLLRDQRVSRIEADAVVGISSTTSWGLDRVDQRSLPLDGVYDPGSTGRGVTAYVVDTGIRFDHQEFGGRAAPGTDVVGDGRSGADCHGHGTHVAGTVGGASYGVAGAVQLVSVRVLNCDGAGTWSGVIAGLDWITANRKLPAVANLSLGGGANSSVDDALRRTIASGVAVVVAAGNSGADACNFSPARVAEAMTIGATDRADARPSWSNYGSCLDWFAPGAGITSAWHTGATAINTLSGTSMAAPHNSGAAALFLQESPGASPAAVREALFDLASRGVVASSGSTNNHLLYARMGPVETPSAISLSARGYKVKGLQSVDLTWSGATSANVSVWRNNVSIATIANRGAYTDRIEKKGGGTYTYKVCEAGGSSVGTCSSTATVTF